MKKGLISARILILTISGGLCFTLSLLLYALFQFDLFRPYSIYCAYLTLGLALCFWYFALQELDERRKKRRLSRFR